MLKVTVRASYRVRLMLLAGAIFLMLSQWLLGQTTISTGSIVGTVTDPQGAVVPSARVTITDKATACGSGWAREFSAWELREFWNSRSS
jgi:hypothetical protein